MRVVIVEDESSAAENLKYLLHDIDAEIKVDRILDTVSSAMDYFSKENDIDLAFFDIHLADGISFDIFEQVRFNVPLIFTTAYDEYALKAFKVNSVDYLLKPIEVHELKEAVDKFKSLSAISLQGNELQSVLRQISQETKKYRSSFLLRQKDKLIPLNTKEVAYFTIDTGRVKAFDYDQKAYLIDEKLEDLEASLDPTQFFRANRQFIVQRNAVKDLSVYFNGKLILNITPQPAERIVISKAKAPQFKAWINETL